MSILPAKMDGANAQLYKTARCTLDRKEQFMPKELEEMKLSTGPRVQLYPKLPPMAMVAEQAHTLQVNK